MPEFTIRQGDLASPIASVLRDADGEPVDIAGADIGFRLQEIGAPSLELDEAASNDQVGDGSDGSRGAVSYQWVSGDTDNDGAHWGVFRADYQDGSGPQSFPNGGYVLVRITPDLPLAAASPFANTLDLEARLGLSLTADEHERAHKLLIQASGLAAEAAGQDIAFIADDEIVLLGSWDDRLSLPQRPVTAVALVSVNGSELLDTEWYLSGSELVRLSGGGWGGPLAAVAVTYSHGFDPVPARVKQVVLEAVNRVWNNPGNVRSEQDGATIVQYDSSAGLLLTDEEVKAVRQGIGQRLGTIQLR